MTCQKQSTGSKRHAATWRQVGHTWRAGQHAAIASKKPATSQPHRNKKEANSNSKKIMMLSIFELVSLCLTLYILKKQYYYYYYSVEVSSEPEAINDDTCCASCGIAANDDIKLKKCNACHLVKYCGVKCQREHRSKHKRECKKRAAELRDEILFKQPESNHHGECPICCLPLALDAKKSAMMTCCSKTICNGCDYANSTREIEENLGQKCPFCRHPTPKTLEDAVKDLMRRVEANDPNALRQLGNRRLKEGNHESAVEYWINAAELGDAGAHYHLHVAYRDGVGVEKDMKKSIYHVEQAAIGGHPEARHNLAYEEYRNGRIERAVKHLTIAANLGLDEALRMLRECYKGGRVTKEDFAAALRAHKAAVDATKSPQREEAEAKW